MLSRDELTYRVQEAIWDEDNDLTSDKYTLDDTFESLGFDSLNVVEVVTFLELDLDIGVTNTEIIAMKTVNDLIDLVTQKCQKN